MMELALVNVALLALLCALPSRAGTRRRADRRRAKTLLRARQTGHRSLAATAADAARRAGRALWAVFRPQLLFPAQPSAKARAALAVPALALAALVVGGPVAIGDVPLASPDARACSQSHDHGDGQMTTAPEFERLTTPAGAGFLTEI